MSSLESWNFQVQFRIPSFFLIDADVDSIPLSPIPSATGLRIAPLASQSICGSTELVLIGQGLASPQKAMECALASKQVLKVACVAARGAAAFSERTTDELLPMPFDDNCDAVANVNESQGICLFREGSRLCAHSSDRVIVDPIEPTALAQVFAATAQGFQPLHPLVDLALDIYSSAFFEASMRSRFLALVTCVEIVAERADRPENQLQALREARSAVMADEHMTQSDRYFLLQILGEAKKESIKEACRRLVSANLGSEKALEFSRFYDLRSHLVHTGQPPSDADIEQESFALRTLASELLTALAKR